MMLGDKTVKEQERRRSLVGTHAALSAADRGLKLPGLSLGEIGLLDEQQPTSKSKLEVFGLEMTKEEGEDGGMQ